MTDSDNEAHSSQLPREEEERREEEEGSDAG
jgi:hypothetical protein